MICQICRENQATIHLTQQKSDKVVKIHVCRRCAEEKGFDYLEKSNFALGDIISGLFGDSAGAVKHRKRANVCALCGTSHEDFRDVAKLGCSECYEFFKPHVMSVLRNLHVKTQHFGKFPKSRSEKAEVARRVTILKEELDRAIAEECYERAAEIRDELRMLDEQDKGREGDCPR
jgi:protein arginine kinase activator